MKYKQCILKSGKETLTCWLDASVVSEGLMVSLRDIENPNQWWFVEKVGEVALEKKDIKDSHESKNWYKKDYLHKLPGLKYEK